MVEHSKKNVKTPSEMEDVNTSALSPFYSRRWVGEKAEYQLGDWQRE